MLLEKIGNQNISHGRVLSLVTQCFEGKHVEEGRLLWPQKPIGDSHWQVRLFVEGRILSCF